MAGCGQAGTFMHVQFAMGGACSGASLEVMARRREDDMEGGWGHAFPCLAGSQVARVLSCSQQSLAAQ